MTVTDAAPSTARALGELLRAHYLAPNRPPAGVFVEEVESPCGKRRADAMWAPLTIAGGTELVGHELKVTRADVLAELADATKAEPWARFCDRWWLVVAHPRLVDGLDVPEAWGIMAPPSGRRTRTMTVVRPAPKLRPVEQARGFRRLLAVAHFRAGDRVREAEWAKQHLETTVARLEREVAELRAGGNRKSPEATRIAGILHAVQQRARAEQLWHEATDEELVDVLVDTIAARQATAAVARELAGTLRELEAAVAPARFVAEQVAALIARVAP